MEFRLTYEGLLLSSGNRPKPEHKHEVRMKLHSQIRRLWETNPELSSLVKYHHGTSLEQIYSEQGRVQPRATDRPYLDVLADAYPMFGTKWAPLVTEGMKVTCALDILYLRPGARGGVYQSGDIDGRLKTLFDALSIPTSNSGLPANIADTNPIFVLLRDDKMISHLSVTTDELLEPTGDQFDKNDSRVVITVSLRPYLATWFNLGFSGH